jgi:prephenate dehydrogenase
MVTALRMDAAGQVSNVLARGVEGRRALPGKHGQRPTPFVVVPVVIKDRPGQLGLLFADAGAAQVNIEDVSIEHSPGQPVGVVELSVRPEQAPALVDALRARGWSVHG